VRNLSIVACLMLAVIAVAANARQGSFIDSLTFITIDSQVDGIQRTIAGDITMHGYQVTGGTVQLLDDNNIFYNKAFSGYRGILFNPVEYSTDGRFNPLGDPVIRLAVQKVCDKELWVSEFLFDQALPMYSPILPTAATHTAIIVDTTKTRLAHAFEEEVGLQMIEDRMIELGGVKNAAGNWTIANSVTGDMEVIEVIGTIRVSDERLQMGDYLCDQMEKAGFTTRRIYGGGGDLYNYWGLSMPADMTWTFYTEGWGSSGISLESASGWGQMYTDQVRGDMPYATMDEAWCDAQFGEGFYENARKIYTGDYNSLEERLQLFRDNEEMARYNPTHIWAWNNASAYMIPEGTNVVHDLAAGTFIHRFVGHTLRFEDADGTPIIGGDMVVSNQEFLVNAINPVDGSNWTYDYMFMRPTQDYPIYSHPHTGIPIPHMVEHAKVEVLTGKPVIIDDTTLEDGWCELVFVDSFDVPGDAWADWDAENQVFLTVDDVYPDGVTDVSSKTTITYPDWLFDGTVKWHDGSTLTLADLVCGLIVGFPFDCAKPESEIYDQYRVSDYNTGMSTFRGVNIVSEDPLVVEFYDSAINLYAETIAQNECGLLWPNSQAGSFEPAWHTFAVGYMTDSEGLGAFGSSKATDLGVDWINYVDGPQLQLLLSNLATAQMTNFLPYAPTLSQYVDEDEIILRYTNLSKFATKHGHLWIGTGPMVLDNVDTLAGITVLRNNPDYFYATGHYVGRGFDEVAIPDVAATGPSTVTIGTEAVFDVDVTLAGEAYPLANMKQVVYLLIDANGEIAYDGEGEIIGEGAARVTLTADQTATLASGANRLEIVVVVKTVVLPGSVQISFVTL
jgi:peptide/nickel transport system substrate-binding protein